MSTLNTAMDVILYYMDLSKKVEKKDAGKEKGYISAGKKSLVNSLCCLPLKQANVYF